MNLIFVVDLQLSAKELVTGVVDFKGIGVSWIGVDGAKFTVPTRRVVLAHEFSFAAELCVERLDLLGSSKEAFASRETHAL